MNSRFDTETIKLLKEKYPPRNRIKKYKKRFILRYPNYRM